MTTTHLLRGGGAGYAVCTVAVCACALRRVASAMVRPQANLVLTLKPSARRVSLRVSRTRRYVTTGNGRICTHFQRVDAFLYVHTHTQR